MSGTCEYDSYHSYDYVTLHGQREIILGGPDQIRWEHKISLFSGWWQKRSDLEEETKCPLPMWTKCELPM